MADRGFTSREALAQKDLRLKTRHFLFDKQQMGAQELAECVVIFNFYSAHFSKPVNLRRFLDKIFS